MGSPNLFQRGWKNWRCLKREIEQGAYQVDSKKLADMLIVKLLLPFQNPPIFHALLDQFKTTPLW